MPRHLLDIRDLSTQELDALMDRADDIIQNPKRYAECMHGKKLATLFYEPSTRTRLSFEAAMLELGGSVLGFSSADSSSAAKGESVADTVRTVGCYADIIAMRHPKEGAPTAAAQVVTLPGGSWKLLSDGISSSLWRGSSRICTGQTVLLPLSATVFGQV